MSEPISTGSEWTFELIEAYHDEIERIAQGYELDTYPCLLYTSDAADE